MEVGPFASIENQLKLLTKYQKQTFQALRDVGINNLPVPKTDTQETENLDKEISLDQEGASLCSLPLSKHTGTKDKVSKSPMLIKRFAVGRCSLCNQGSCGLATGREMPSLDARRLAMCSQGPNSHGRGLWILIQS